MATEADAVTVMDRMANPVMPASAHEVDLFDPEVQQCPYPAYERLREEAPIWKDPVAGFYVVTRYEDIRQVLLDPVSFSSSRKSREQHIDKERVARILNLYETKGVLPAPTMGSRDDPDHAAIRKLFDKAFRASKIKELDPVVEEVASRLIDDFIDDGHCDWVKQFAVPLPLIIIGRQMGAREEDIWRIKGWTDAFVKRLGLMQNEEEETWSVEQEIEQQHFFNPIIARLREQPDDSLLSELVNTVIPEWGRTMNDNEIHAELGGDTFVGGSETSTNALSGGIMLLAHNRPVWEQLRSNPDKYLKTFVEEVLRLESPVQSLFRVAARDVEMHGVTIPKGAYVNVRYAAANRDDAHFECPEKLDLDRKNAGSHLAFGSGIHHCLGAPLARRELYFGFKMFLERIDDFWLAEGRNQFRHQPNFCLRALNELHIEFRKK